MIVRSSAVTKVEGRINDVEFTLSGPPDAVQSIVTYIRNLTNLINNKVETSIQEKRKYGF